MARITVIKKSSLVKCKRFLFFKYNVVPPKNMVDHYQTGFVKILDAPKDGFLSGQLVKAATPEGKWVHMTVVNGSGVQIMAAHHFYEEEHDKVTSGELKEGDEVYVDRSGIYDDLLNWIKEAE